MDGSSLCPLFRQLNPGEEVEVKEAEKDEVSDEKAEKEDDQEEQRRFISQTYERCCSPLV